MPNPYKNSFDPENTDYSNTDHAYGTYSRTGEFNAGSKWNSDISGLRGAMEATNKFRFRDTTGGPHGNQIQDIESIEYPERARKAITDSKGFAPNRKQSRQHYN